MPGAQRRCLWRSLSLAVATYAAAWSATDAKESSASVKDAEQYFASGNLEAAEIELKNAVRQSPKDPAIHLRLAAVYLRLGDAASGWPSPLMDATVRPLRGRMSPGWPPPRSDSQGRRRWRSAPNTTR